MVVKRVLRYKTHGIPITTHVTARGSKPRPFVPAPTQDDLFPHHHQARQARITERTACRLTFPLETPSAVGNVPYCSSVQIMYRSVLAPWPQVDFCCFHNSYTYSNYDHHTARHVFQCLVIPPYMIPAVRCLPSHVSSPEFDSQRRGDGFSRHSMQSANTCSKWTLLAGHILAAREWLSTCDTRRLK